MRNSAVPLPEVTITAFEMQRKPAAFQRRALQEPLTVTSNGEPTLVVMSVEEYQKLIDRVDHQKGSHAAVSRKGVSRGMRRRDAIAKIRKHRHDLEELGVTSIALFGSVARDQADEMSDVDVVVDTSGGRALGLFALARINDFLEDILGRPIDVISRRGLDHTKQLKRRVATEIVDVF